MSNLKERQEYLEWLKWRIWKTNFARPLNSGAKRQLAYIYAELEKIHQITRPRKKRY